MSFARPRPVAGIAILVGVVALIAGCGGGDSDSLSADEFRTQADAICTDYNTQADALTDPSSPSQYLASLKEILPLQQAQITKLEDLKPPSELEDDFSAALDLLKKQTTALTSATTRIEGGEDPSAVITDLGTEAGSLGDQADARAKALGLEVCGSDGDTDTGTTSTTATAPATGTAPATETAPATGTAPTTTSDTTAYVADVQSAATALQSFGNLLSSSTGIDDLKAKIPEAEKNLDTFDASIAKLDDYTLGVATLDEQRAGLARTGPKVSDVLRRFLDAVGTGDLAEVQKLVPEVTTTIGEFQAAATGS